MISSYRKPQADHICLVIKRLYTQTSSCRGPAGGAPAVEIGGGVSAERISWGTPPNSAWWSEIATKTRTQTNFQLRNLAEPRAPAGPLRSSPGVCDGGVVRAYRSPWMVLSREVGAPSNVIRRFRQHAFIC
jgi:hypothetical protein